MVDWLVDNWDQPDEGIWETRGGRQDFTYGRVMSLGRAGQGDPPGRGQRPTGATWSAGSAARDAIYEQIIDRGWNPRRQAFVQYYGTESWTPRCWRCR